MASGAEFGGEFSGAAVKGVDEFGGNSLDGFEEAGEVGVIGEREECVDAVAVLRAGGESPAAEHGSALGFEVFDERCFSEIRRGDDDGAGGDGAAEEFGFGEIDSGFANGLGHLVNRLVENDGKLGTGEDSVDFLGFAERVGIEDGRLTEIEPFLGEGENVGVDFFGGREDEAREPEGGFHREDIGLGEDRGFGGEGIARFEVAGVEEGLAIVLDSNHGGAGDVSGRKELDVVLVDRDLIFPVEEEQAVFGD